MAQQREITTDRLVGIIASIKMDRRSGQLTVRRGEGSSVEEGMLMFIQGQITQANIGRRHGPEALNWLSTWRQARYTFTPLTSDEDVHLTAFSTNLPSSSLGGVATNPRLSTAPVNTDSLESPHPLARAYGVPYTTADLTEATIHIKKAGLSRSHRRLFLLIDGHRSALGLVPLMGKSAEEVRNMLHDLEWLGIVRITNPPTL
jgi:hypothetical protein